MQQTLSSELRSVIERRIRLASSAEILTIATSLCAEELMVGETMTVESVPGKSLRFQVQDDTVLDRRTGLMWSRATVAGGRKTWKEAISAAESVTLGGFKDWRLPTIRELLSIVDYERHDPAIDTTVFQCDSAWYWSSTPLASSPGDFAWGVSFDSGSAGWDSQDGSGFVRACRPGQSVEHWF